MPIAQVQYGALYCWLTNFPREDELHEGLSTSFLLKSILNEFKSLMVFVSSSKHFLLVKKSSSFRNVYIIFMSYTNN